MRRILADVPAGVLPGRQRRRSVGAAHQPRQQGPPLVQSQAGGQGGQGAAARCPRRPRPSRAGRSRGRGRRGGPRPPATAGRAGRRRPAGRHGTAAESLGPHDVGGGVPGELEAGDRLGQVGHLVGGRPAGAGLDLRRTPATPPSYWSVIRRPPPSSMRTWASALRARWVSTCPTVHRGSRLERATVASSRPPRSPSRRACAARAPATAAAVSSGGATRCSVSRGRSITRRRRGRPTRAGPGPRASCSAAAR